jgi:DNA-binding CsgD family transcriptional regulator
MPFDQLILFAAATAATIAILIFAHTLSRKYLQDYLRYYFYHLLLASPLALLGKPFPVLIAGFTQLEGLQADRFYILFDRLLAKPLWIGSLYLLIKCLAAMAGRKPSRPFTLAYFGLGGALLAAGWIQMIGFFRTDRLSDAAVALGQAFNYLDIFLPLAIFAVGIFVYPQVADNALKKTLRTFGWIGLVSRAVFWALILLHFSFTIPFLFGVVLPVPALLTLAAYLKKASPSPPHSTASPESLDAFCAKFNITPREKEIVELVCAGRGNQAIADSLFISIHTVKRHVNQIYQKADVRNRVQLANAVRESAKPVSARD